MQEIHEIDTDDREYRLGTLGQGTLAVAVLAFAYGAWTGRYLLCVAIVAAEALLVLWTRRGGTFIKVLHWLLLAAALLWILRYVFFDEPELFYLIDTYLLSR